MSKSIDGQSTELSDPFRRLANVYEQDDLWHVLDLDEPWQASDLPTTNEKSQALMNRLRAMGAIRVVGSKRDTSGTRTTECHLYEFVDGIRERLEDYREETARFPCGHRAHIHHRDGGDFGCQYCDVARDYDRETVRELIA